MCLIGRCQSRAGKQEFGCQQFGCAESPLRVCWLTKRIRSAGKGDASPKQAFHQLLHPLQRGLGIKTQFRCSWRTNLARQAEIMGNTWRFPTPRPIVNPFFCQPKRALIARLAW